MQEEQQRNHTDRAVESIDRQGEPELIKLLLLISRKPLHCVKALKLA